MYGLKLLIEIRKWWQSFRLWHCLELCLFLLICHYCTNTPYELISSWCYWRFRNFKKRKYGSCLRWLNWGINRLLGGLWFTSNWVDHSKGFSIFIIWITLTSWKKTSKNRLFIKRKGRYCFQKFKLRSSKWR